MGSDISVKIDGDGTADGGEGEESVFPLTVEAVVFERGSAVGVEQRFPVDAHFSDVDTFETKGELGDTYRKIQGDGPIRCSDFGHIAGDSVIGDLTALPPSGSLTVGIAFLQATADCLEGPESKTVTKLRTTVGYQGRYTLV